MEDKYEQYNTIQYKQIVFNNVRNKQVLMGISTLRP